MRLASLALFALLLPTAACPPSVGSPDAGPPASSCIACLSSDECTGGSCVQIGSDDACAAACTSDSDCGNGEACSTAVTSSGDTVDVCIPTSGSCTGAGCGTCADGTVCDPTTGTCVDAPASEQCGTLVGPSITAACHSCSAGSNCQANGCYGGWWCDTSGNRCHAPPDACGDNVDAGPLPDAGPITGSVTVNGGTVSRLYFAVVGDTRPPDTDLTDQYPQAVVDKIYDDINGLNPKPQFVLTTGDYMFAKKNGTESTPQLTKYVEAMSRYHGGPVFPTLGNHECTGYTSDNCATTSTANLRAFQAQLLNPLGLDLYYVVPFNATDGSWTGKLVVAACNAWDATQKAWLTDQLSQSTTYTVVARHEPSSADTAPCVTEMDAVLAAHAYSLLIVGHTHTFSHYGKEIVVGNGGAPLTGSAPFGFATFELVPGTGFRVREYDSATNAPVRTFDVFD